MIFIVCISFFSFEKRFSFWNLIVTWLWIDTLIYIRKCIFQQSIANSMQNFDVFCPSRPDMVYIQAKIKLVKFYGNFPRYSFEKLIQTLGSGTSFLCTFSAWFFRKSLSYLILYQWTKFQCHTFFRSQDIKQNVLLSFYLGSWWRYKLQNFSWNNLESNDWQGEKEAKTEIQKFEYLESRKSFLDEIKNIIHSCWRSIIW